MRTTIRIDDDVLAAAKALASQHHTSLGEVISSLARQSLRRTTTNDKLRNGIPLLPVRSDANPVTPELVNELRDDLL